MDDAPNSGPYIDVPPGRDEVWARDVKVPVGPIKINLSGGRTVERTVIYVEWISPRVLRLWLDEEATGDA